MIDSARPASASARHVLTLMTGTTLAQAIALAISPILTRLYAPEQFGVFALYLSIVALLAIVATGRYELAIVLPESDVDAWHLCALALLIAAAVSVSTLLGVWIFGERIAARVGDARMADWLFIVSHTKPGTYAYMKLVNESKYVVIRDRRKADRRRIHQRATPERRNGERRRRDVMTDLQKSGWALVRR